MNKYNLSAFPTDHFNLSAYLISKECNLIDTDRTNPKRVIFIFEYSEKLKMLKEKFLSYKAQVEPNRFCSAQKNLKQLIYQNK